jgi:hypothetical protein
VNHHPLRSLFCTTLLAIGVGTVSAADVRCDGVLGNSGEQGAALVRFASEPARGIGVAIDSVGSLWDRAGKGRLNRYAPDGRLLASFRITGDQNGNDQLALVGDTLVLFLGGQLYSLSTSAPSGSEATPLKRDARCISFSAHQGRIAMATRDQVLLLDPLSGQTSVVGPFKEADAVEIGPDGEVYAMKEGKMHRLKAPAGDGWPRGGPGERPQFLDGWWYGHAWHGTIRRADVRLDPAPGVVLGGASGSFIGHLDQNSELSNSRGMGKLWDGVFALSGIGGILQLASWDGAKSQFTVVRRIGAVPVCRGLGLDRDGNVFHHTGVWRWDDAPDAPLRFQVNVPEGLGQVVMLDDRRSAAAAYMWGKPAFIRGPLTGEVSIERIEKACALPKETVGAAAWKADGGWTLLTLMPDGAHHAFALDPEGRYRSDLQGVKLATAAPVAAWTSLGMLDGKLMAAGDGHVIAFERDGEGWRESRRWNSWGTSADQRFGSRIHLASDGRSLVVADRERQRVLGFAGTGGAPRWSFGTVDKAGADLSTCDHPETVAVQGGRVVVFDAGNQRLLKLRITGL